MRLKTFFREATCHDKIVKIYGTQYSTESDRNFYFEWAFQKRYWRIAETLENVEFNHCVKEFARGRVVNKLHIKRTISVWHLNIHMHISVQQTFKLRMWQWP
jgi:hypothetical protein